MDVALVYCDECPNWRTVDAHLRDALALIGRSAVIVRYREIETLEQAEAEQFRGSPTVLVDGRDPFLDRDRPIGLCCRVYWTPDGVAGAPSTEQLTEVLR